MIKEKIIDFYNNKMKLHEKNILSYLRSEYLTNCAVNSKEMGIQTEKICDFEVIVSLTTYNARFYEVYLAIESIMQQTLKPNKIILWLAEDLKINEIPIVLKNQMKRGLEIRYCKDLLSYKKLIPSLKIFPNSIIITIDDDHMYLYDLIENFINEHKKIKN